MRPFNLAGLCCQAQCLWRYPEQLRRTAQIKPGFDPVVLGAVDRNLAILPQRSDLAFEALDVAVVTRFARCDIVPVDLGPIRPLQDRVAGKL